MDYEKYDLEAKSMGGYIDDYDMYKKYKHTQDGLFWVAMVTIMMIGYLVGAWSMIL